MVKLDKKEWITELFTFIEIDGDMWIKLDANHLEKLPDNSITKWLRKRLEDKGVL